MNSTQNRKIEQVKSTTLVVGIDVGSEFHYARAFDNRGYEFSKKPFKFSNSEHGFGELMAWMQEIKEKQGMEDILPGMEPTGQYWFVRPYRVILKCRDTRLSHCSGIFLSAGARGVIGGCRAG